MKQKFLLVFILSTVVSLFANAQCITGDCVNGKGTKKYPDSSRFDGSFEKGTKKCGTYYYKSGDVYKGCFEKNQRAGFGTYSYKSGEVFNGYFQNDQKLFGEFQYSSGNVYKGALLDNQPDGYGTMSYKDGSKWEGLWQKGRKVWGGDIGSFADTIYTVSDSASGKSIDGIVTAKAVMPRLFAIVVGVADYEGSSSDLNFCDDDATNFYQHLQAAMPREMAAGKSVLLTNKNATRSNIIRSINDIFSMATENDFILFFFSGHGNVGFFSPSDLSSGMLYHSEVKKYFKASRAKYKVCIADACHSGSIGASTSYQQSVQSVQNLADVRLAVMMSSRPSQQSLEMSNLGQGVFSYYLINGLKGAADLNQDKYVTMGELFMYTKRSVESKTGGGQVPVIFGKGLHLIPLTRLK